MKMESQIRLVNMDDIIPNRFQPRLQFDTEALNELAASIRVHGIIQPLVLRRIGNKYEIIAGERRYKASQLVGLTQVPAIICALDDNESAEVAIIENTHRKDLNPIEEAESYKKLLDRKYITQDQLAQRLGTSQSNIANKIRLLSLDENVQQALLKNQISERHARSLLKLTDKMVQVKFLNKTINERLTVKQLDDEIAKFLGTYKEPSGTTGAINTNSIYDVNVNDIINNSSNIDSNENIINRPQYQYHSKIKEDPNKKDSLFFNNLENAPATLDDPSLNFGFNPFETKDLTDNNGMLDLENTQGIDDELEDNDSTNESSNDKTKTVYKEMEYKSLDDVKQGIKNIINNAIKNDVDIKLEEFDFDNIYQYVIRISKDKVGK